MDTIYLPVFTYFTESYWEADSPLVFRFEVVYQILFNVLGTPQLSMAYTYGFPKAAPSLTNTEEVVTPPTLWWCTSCHDPCLPLNFMNLYPTDIKNSVLYLLITPPHNCLTKLGLPDTKTQEYCKLLSLIAWLGGNHPAPINVPPCKNFLKLEGAQNFNT